MPLYREFTSIDALDQEYKLSATVPDYLIYPPQYQAKSQALLQDFRHQLHIAYGPTLAEHIDIFPATKPNAPVFIFIHGGYWRAFASKDFLFTGRALLEQGAAVVHINYALFPLVSLDEIVRQVRAACSWCIRNAQDFNGDSDRVYVGGHSAGGQLSMMAALTDWQTDYGLPADCIKGVLPISGLMDLAPLRYTFLQPYLQLSAASIERNSPCQQIKAMPCPALFTVGEHETAEMRRQSRDFAAQWQQIGNAGELWIAPERNHFDILNLLESDDNPLMQKLLAMMGLA